MKQIEIPDDGAAIVFTNQAIELVYGTDEDSYILPPYYPGLVVCTWLLSEQGEQKLMELIKELNVL